MKILVCDDEPSVRNIISMILKSLEHQVVVACDGQEAFEKIQVNPAAFDFLITDNLMPRLSGVKLVEKLRALNLPMKIIMLTGFAPQLNTEVLDRPLFDGVLIKPFKALDILKCLKTLSVEKQPLV